MPVLAVVGGRDVLIDSAGTRDRLTRFVPRSKAVFLPGARHFIPGQTSTVMAFLSDRDVAWDQGG